ncbi:MAG: A24 family peptidase [bacterium]
MNETVQVLGPWIAFVLGAVVGSFANVCIHRLPRGESILHPPSHCPHCREPIRWQDNIPILSYVWLRGRCRECGERISPRYAAVELITALLFTVLWFNAGGEAGAFLMQAAFVTALVIGTGIDLEHRLLPDAVTLPLLAIGLASSLPAGGLSPLRSVTGMLAGGGGMYLVAEVGDRVYRQPTMGGGDIKLAAALGAWLGWRLLIVALFAAFLLGAVIGTVYMVAGGREKTVPFGPFLAAGAILALVAGPSIWNWYTGFLG